MTPADPEPDDRDPLERYAAGDRAAADALAPDDPAEADWDAVRRAVHARVWPAPAPRRSGSRGWLVAAAGGLVAACAAAVAWFALPPAQVVQLAEAGRAPAPDPLAEWEVLPVASADEVDLRRVPGAGWLPVGADPLPAVLALAGADDVELDDAGTDWGPVAPAPGDAPMIFAKPR